MNSLQGGRAACRAEKQQVTMAPGDGPAGASRSLSDTGIVARGRITAVQSVARVRRERSNPNELATFLRTVISFFGLNRDEDRVARLEGRGHAYGESESSGWPLEKLGPVVARLVIARRV